MYWFEFFIYFIFFGWIPILAFKSFICGIIEAIKDKQCVHELEFEETNIASDFSNIPVNVSVSVTCKKCGYHKSYLKYKN